MARDGKEGVKTGRKKSGGRCDLPACPIVQPLLSARANAAVAQLVEHDIRNVGVGGSSPFCGTIFEISGKAEFRQTPLMTI